jgi:transcription initiation factor TFIID subunit 9B
MSSPAGPLTPPAEPISQPTQTTSSSQPAAMETLLSQPLTSLSDDGTSKRPRDHRLMHLLLASHGVSAYQQRVPLMLMDFAYRYTSSVLNDALHIQSESYDTADGGPAKGRGKANNQAKNEEGDVSMSALKIAIGSRVGNQFQASLPKEFLKQLADDRNRISLQSQIKESSGGPTVGGIRLPHEKYCLTGVGWGLKDEWDSEGEESIEDNDEQQESRPEPEDLQMQDQAMEDDDEEGAGNMEDIFGNDDNDEGEMDVS